MTDVAIVTETWFRDSLQTSRTLEDFENSTDNQILTRNRDDGRRGGGVALFFNKHTLQLTPVRFKKTKHKIVAAIARRTGQRRKILFIGLYLPPSYDANETDNCMRTINEIILQLTNRYKDPHVVLAGDLNKRDIRKATSNFPCIRVLQTGPTRGSNVLDVIATTLHGDLIESGITEPIATSDGTQSDHKTVYASFRMPRVQS